MRRKALQVTIDGETYRVQPSEDAYDLEVIAEPVDTVLGYIAGLSPDRDGFVEAAAINQVVPEGHAELKDGIRALAR